MWYGFLGCCVFSSDRILDETTGKMTGRVLLLIVGLSVLKISDSKNCVKQNSCLCVFDDGSGAISLYDVGRNDGSPL